MSYLTEISDIIYCDLLTLFIFFLFNKTAALILDIKYFNCIQEFDEKLNKALLLTF